jgi:hypothetical protein
VSFLHQKVSVRSFLVPEIASFLQKLIKKTQNTDRKVQRSWVHGAGDFDKLTGAQHSEKVAENFIVYWKAVSAVTDAEAAAVDKFKEDLTADELVIHIATGELVRPRRGGDTSKLRRWCLLAPAAEDSSCGCAFDLRRQLRSTLIMEGHNWEISTARFLQTLPNFSLIRVLYV